jgi:hypothetical protein
MSEDKKKVSWIFFACVILGVIASLFTVTGISFYIISNLSTIIAPMLLVLISIPLSIVMFIAIMWYFTRKLTFDLIIYFNVELNEDNENLLKKYQQNLIRYFFFFFILLLVFRIIVNNI